MAFSPDSSKVLTSTETEAQIVELPSGRVVATMHGEWIGKGVFSPDGHTVLTTNGFKNKPEDQDAYLWDSMTGHLIWRLQLHQQLVLFAIYSPDGKSILSVSQDRTYAISNAVDGTLLRRGPIGEGFFNKPGFTHDASAILIPHGNVVDVIDVKSGQVLTTVEAGARVVSIIVREKKIVVAGASGQITILNYPNLTVSKFELSGAATLTSVEMSADGSKFLGLNEKYNGSLWDASTGQRLEHLNLAGGIATFSPDGAQIFVGTSFGLPTKSSPGVSPSRIINVNTGEVVSRLYGLDNFPNFAFSPNGEFLLTTAMERNQTKIWTASSIEDGKE